MYFDSHTLEAKPKEQELASNIGYISRPKPRDEEDDFERFNRKRSSAGLTTVSEAQFEDMMDQLSISGSESDSEDEESSVSYLNTQSPFVLFQSSLLDAGLCFGAYKTVLNAQNEEPLENLKKLATLGSGKSALFMLGGGHFAGAIISHERINTKGNSGSAEELRMQSVRVLHHKTFHRYTTRRKQGGAQNASDNAKGKAKSAGSTLRRYNEQALQQDVRNLLAEWKKELDGCEYIFIKASGSASHKIIVGYPNSPIQNDDPRPDPEAVDDGQTGVTGNRGFQGAGQSAQAVKSSGSNFVCEKNKIDVNMELQPETEYANTPTMLHFAAASKLSHMCQVLLVNLKADPAIKNRHGRTAYELASQHARYSFQVARNILGEDYCDWEAARVKEPMTKEEVERILSEEKRQSDEESKRLIDEQLEKAKQEAEEEHSRQFGRGRPLGITEQQNLNSLTPEQRMRVLREQRARAAEARLGKLGK
ncbi:zinc finger-containing protein [Ogataea parapolymorpha DL-1]|uniref:Zinc finger-containing protein n=1 Tax=Ogataea parapolymorpha (strain ATCC 26012 / BCRC 20466 / JCM 22074 / NRRL Y-7560 / DL-1) TaxID=871575 RepID=W1QG63_OGAPD|nr:zinc finger-containing protein [Ogataea parapolymorpha DL-1]ESX00121.1 zinc finger-containing protein [Ogataea parapolymorpha DL-1]